MRQFSLKTALNKFLTNQIISSLTVSGNQSSLSITYISGHIYFNKEISLFVLLNNLQNMKKNGDRGHMFGRKENELLFLPSPSLGDIVCNINALLPNMNYTTLRCQSRLVAVAYSGLIIFLREGSVGEERSGKQFRAF